MMFRPQPYMTLFSIVALAVLIGLGNWQMDRRAWKQAMVDDYAAMAERAPVELGVAVCTPDGLQNPVYPPRVTNQPVLRFFGYSEAGDPGWRLLSAAVAPNCLAPAELLLVQTGFERLSDGVVEPGPDRLRLALMPAPNVLSAGNIPEANEWHRFLRSEMAGVYGLNSDQLSEIWARPDEAPISLTRTPPVRHLGYAVTWYGLALALIGVYFAYHVREGRLKLRK